MLLLNNFELRDFASIARTTDGTKDTYAVLARERSLIKVELADGRQGCAQCSKYIEVIPE